MALILSIETATKICSVALHLNGDLLASHEILLPKSHVEYLMEVVNTLFVTTPYKKSDLSAIAVSEGPGSYTGLRIGVSVAKGLCYGLKIPLIAVNTLEAMLYTVNKFNIYSAYICPMIDARRTNVYCLIANHQMQIIEPSSIISLDKASFQNYYGDKILVFGDGADKHEKLFEGMTNILVIKNLYPNASSMGQISYKKFLNQDFENIEIFSPLYITNVSSITEN
jgi:tRNA threonylcarbamoyladenosine biosynthesis protein TsaB